MSTPKKVPRRLILRQQECLRRLRTANDKRAKRLARIKARAERKLAGVARIGL